MKKQGGSPSWKLQLALRMLSTTFAVCEEAYECSPPGYWRQELLDGDSDNIIVPQKLRNFKESGRIAVIEKLLGRRSEIFASKITKRSLGDLRIDFWQRPAPGELSPPKKLRKEPCAQK